MGYADPNAKVSIKMKGLGTAFLNKNTNLWEFMFLRGIPDHNLKIIVRRYKKRIITPEETVHSINEDVKNLKITTTNASTSSNLHTPAGPAFSFNYNLDNHHDARWNVDLSELHGDLVNPAPVKIEKQTAKRKLTLLTVSDALFHCFSLSQEIYKFTRAGTSDKPRNVGLWIGLDVGWQDTGKTEIFIDGNPVQKLEPADDLDYYEIEVNNDCKICPISDELDFRYYYDELICEDRITQTGPYWLNKKVEIDEKILFGRVDCHLVYLSKITDKTGKERKSLGELL